MCAAILVTLLWLYAQNYSKRGEETLFNNKKTKAHTFKRLIIMISNSQDSKYISDQFNTSYLIFTYIIISSSNQLIFEKLSRNCAPALIQFERGLHHAISASIYGKPKN